MDRGIHEFHDSYYYHTCLIIPEKDVLETDIVGTGFATSIRRWWNDLFLLSYTAGRSRGFYTSSHAMRTERFRQFRKYKHRIHPMSKFRNMWDFLILHVFILNKIIFIYTSSFIFDNLPIFLFYFGAFFEIIIIADLYVNLKTGYINHEAKRVILDTEKSLINFCTKKLFIHFASAMPLHWLMFLRYGTKIACGMCKSNRFICALKIISIFSLFRVFETSRYWTQKSRSTNRIHFFKFLRIGAVGIVTLCQFYDLSDVISLLLFIRKGEVVEKSLLGIRAGFKYGDVNLELPNYFYISYDINRILKSFQLFSFGISKRLYYLDKVIALIGYVIAKTFYVWLLLECFAFIGRQMYPKDVLTSLRYRVLSMLSTRQLPEDLQIKVQHYFDFRPTKLRVVEKTNQLYRMLPQVLKDEIKLSCYLKLIMRIPFFADLPLPVIEQIVLLLNKKIFLRNAIVAEAWVQAEGLMIIDNGVLAVYSHNRKEQGHLIDGDFFGGLSLVTDQELCVSFVVAVTTCTILLLEKNQFRNLMRNHPKLFLAIKMQMKEQYKKSDDDNLVVSRRMSDLSVSTAQTFAMNPIS